MRKHAKGPPNLQEDIQLLSNVIDCGNLGLRFLNKVILLLLELISPFLEPTCVDCENETKGVNGDRYLWRSESSKFNLLIIS